MIFHEELLENSDKNNAERQKRSYWKAYTQTFRQNMKPNPSATKRREQ